MNALALVAGVAKLSRSDAVLSLQTPTPLRFALAAKIVTLLALLATLVVVGVRAATDVGIGLPASFLTSTSPRLMAPISTSIVASPPPMKVAIRSMPALPQGFRALLRVVQLLDQILTHRFISWRRIRLQPQLKDPIT